MQKKLSKQNPETKSSFSVEEIQSIIMMVETSNITKLKLQRGDQSLEIEKSPVPVMVQESAKLLSVNDLALESKMPLRAESEEKIPGKDDSNLVVVEAPIVGIFYRKPTPNAEPFVEIGQTVKAGDTLCIIEAMKIMNQVKAPSAGVIEEILVEDGQMVEYGEALFRIRKS